MQISYDLHIHSCLSLCAEDDCTPASIAGMAALAGLDAFGLSDHQSARNCPAAERAALEYGLIFVPGIELETSEEVHVLCLFRETAMALAFSEYIGQRLLITPPAHKMTWRQSVTDELDNVVAQETRWLGSPSDIGIYQAAKLVGSFGGLAIPAHIDRPSHSLLSNLGLYDPDMGFLVCEVSNDCDLPQLLERNPQLKGMRFIRNSDSHELASIPDAQNYLDVDERSAAGIIDALSLRHRL